MGNDYIVRASAAGSAIRAFAVTSRDLVEEARTRHNTSPIVTAALGRLMSGAVMMGAMMKGEKDLLTLQIKSDGPLRGMVVTADSAGHVKGYPYVPDVMLPPSPKGKLDVGGAVGEGMLTVLKDIGMKEPYMGQTVLQTGEIAEDLTYYFAVSEQVPSAVGLGVLMNKNNTVRQAGGFIIQLLPFTSDEIIDKLEQRINTMEPVTTLLDRGLSPEQMLEYILGDFEIEYTEKMPAEFYCNCSHERVEKAVVSLGKKEIRKMVEDGETIEVKCDFCNTAYHFTVDELKEILKR